jgi:hypothetical protein
MDEFTQTAAAESYAIHWALCGWDLRSDSQHYEEAVAGGVLLTDEQFANLEEAVLIASDWELLAGWHRDHGPGVAVVLDQEGQRRAGPYFAPPREERERIFARQLHQVVTLTEPDEPDEPVFSINTFLN